MTEGGPDRRGETCWAASTQCLRDGCHDSMVAFYSLNTYLLSVNEVPSIAQGAGDIDMDRKKKKSVPFWSVHAIREREA